MKKPGILLTIVGGLIGVGIVLSFYGNYVIFEDLRQTEGDVSVDQNLIVEVELDSNETQTGIYAIQIIENIKTEVEVSILDPFNSVIETQTVNKEVFEGFFDVTNSGTYKLLIENKGESVKIFGVIGPEPDEGKRSLGFISLYILAVGLVGMVGVTVYMVINRKKSFS